VYIAAARSIEKKPSWSLKYAVTHLNVKLSIEMPDRLRPTSFEKDARELVARMRCLQVAADGRLIGRLTLEAK